MLILNVNGPINSGKTTVSKLLVQKIPNAVFIEVDDLMSDEEEVSLGLERRAGFEERRKRLDHQLTEYKKSKTHDVVIFAYPMTEKDFKRWQAFADDQTQFLNITLAPDLETCLRNRGMRSLTEWEKNRIRQMYEEGYHNREGADLIINNTTQTPEETAEVILAFVTQTQNPEQQWLHLVERRWTALLSGEKISTIRLNEGFVHKGFLVYRDCPNERFAEVVYVNRVYYIPLRQAVELEGFDDHTPNEEVALTNMKKHYPNITLDTLVLFVQHLSVPETRKKYKKNVADILKKFKNHICSEK